MQDVIDMLFENSPKMMDTAPNYHIEFFGDMEPKSPKVARSDRQRSKAILDTSIDAFRSGSVRGSLPGDALN
jgi:hypothetical protein